MKKKLIFLVFFLTFLILMVLFIGLYEVRFLNTKASLRISSFSQDNSYLFTTPIQAKADGKEKIRLTVFILDERGLGVMGKKVRIMPHQAMFIEEIQGLTDNFGKSYFDISATQPGEYFLRIFVDEVELKQKARLSFY
ncbi:MAG: hypothetical protein NZL96_01835 [Patescibacteria group bacterium]|nr:hypothetical protein [Patescibacteria group bacterium]